MSKNNKKGKGPSSSSSSRKISPDVAAHYFSQVAAAAKSKNDKEEVKALMNMFAEIMGMATEGKAPVILNGGSGPGPSPSAVAAAARAASAASMYIPDGWSGIDFYEEDDEDDDDDEEEEDSHNSIPELMSGAASVSTKMTIDPRDWESLEQVARDETLEEEEKARKAAKKREKKQRKKERARKEAAEKAAQAAQLKQQKLMQSWRSRVVSACQSNDPTKLQALLKDSPLSKQQSNNHNAHDDTGQRDHVQSQLEFLLPTCIAKSHDQVEPFDCRMKLAAYVLDTCLSLEIVFAIGRTKRNYLHSACFVGDTYFIRFLFERIRERGEGGVPVDYLRITCEDSGWAPIHYAVLSGSQETVEVLLAQGANVSQKTDESLTCIGNSGVTPKELAEAILASLLSKPTKLDCDGGAIEDINTIHTGTLEDRRRYENFLRDIISRLVEIQKNGYMPSAGTEGGKAATEAEEPDATQRTNTTSKKKKKKKKKAAAVATAPAPAAPASVSESKDDPMITLLVGMGFTVEQITKAAKACGGTDRATPDDIIAKIFEQEASGPEEEQSQNPPETARKEEARDEDQKDTWTAEGPSVAERQKKAMSIAEEERLKEMRKAEEARLAAQRLAAKREEQRRRNREWNNREQARQREEAHKKLHQAAQLKARHEAYRASMGQIQPPYTGPPPPVAPVPTGMVGVPQGHPVLHQPNPPVAAASVAKRTNQQKGVPKPIVPTGPVKILTRPKNKRPVEGVNIPAKPPVSSKMDIPVAVNPQTSDFPGLATGLVTDDALTVSSLGSAQIGGGESFQEADFHQEPPALLGYQGAMTTPQGVPPGFGAGSSLISPGLPVADLNPFPVAPGNAVRVPGGQAMLADSNLTGEIRATAKAFIPSTFKSAPDNSIPLPMGGNIQDSPAYHVADFPTALGDSDPGSKLLNPGMSSFLAGGLGNNNNTQLPPTVSSYSPVPSTTSSVTGITAQEELAPPLVGFGLASSNPQPISSSLLGGIALDPNPTRSMKEDIIPSASIWGGSTGATTNVSQSALMGVIPSLNGVGGFSQMGDGDQNGQKPLWGGTQSNGGAGSGASSGMGSIW